MGGCAGGGGIDPIWPRQSLNKLAELIRWTSYPENTGMGYSSLGLVGGCVCVWGGVII